MRNIDNVIISEGIYNAMIIIEPDNKKYILNNDSLTWHEENLEHGERYLTLGEIYEQLKHRGYKNTIYVWQETPLEGKIYLCGNYQEGQWLPHGTTKGYA